MCFESDSDIDIDIDIDSLSDSDIDIDIDSLSDSDYISGCVGPCLVPDAREMILYSDLR